jgi:hypothetical protein
MRRQVLKSIKTANLARRLDKTDVPAFGSHEATQVTRQIVNCRDDTDEFHDARLVSRGVPEIRADRFFHFTAVSKYGRTQPRKARLALGMVRSRLPSERRHADGPGAPARRRSERILNRGRGHDC